MILYNPSISGSLVVTGSNISLNGVNVLLSNETSSISVLSSSFASTASYVLNGVSSSFSSNALTSSNAMTASSADTLYVRNNVTALGSITAQTLIVQTVTSSVLFTTGSNKIGSSLSNTQELTGSVGITGSLTVTTTGTEFQVSAGGVSIGNALTDNHIISGSVTINPNGLFVSSSGNVGIGTVNPNQSGIGLSNRVLTVKAVSSGGEALLELIGLGNNATDNIAKINFMNQAATTALASIEAIRGSSDTVGELSFKTSNTTRLTIASTGVATFTNSVTGQQGVNVGANALGTDRMFQVSGTAFTSGSTQFGIVNNPTMTTPTTIYGYYGGVTVTSATNGYGLYIVSATGTITNKFGIYQEGTNDKNYFAGNVGIGTSSPSQKLEVIGTTKLSSAAGNITGINIIPGSVTNTYQTIGESNSATVRFHAGIVTGWANWENWGSSYMDFKVESKPSGTTDQSFTAMQIRPTGDIRMSILTGTGTRTVVADANGQLSAPVSDKSVKENIRPIGYGINDIMKMNPVWFEFKDEFKDYGTGRQNGNIAQELEAIIPEAVFLTPQTNRKGIEYGQLHAVYIKAIQELKAENDSLKEILLRNNIV